MTNEAEVYFCLYADDFDPAEVTRAVGIEPTSTRRPADPTPHQTSWELSTGRVQDDIIDVYELSSDIVGKLAPQELKIRAVIKRLGLKAILQIVLWISMDESKSTPAIGFEPAVVRFLSAVGASVDIDTYRH